MTNRNLFLLVKTNKYTGNFERELLSWVFGYEDDKDSDYKECFKKYLDKFEAEMDIDDAYEIRMNFDTTRLGRNCSEYYGTDICRDPANPDGECNCIFIAVRNYFPDGLFEQIKDRVKSFIKYYDTDLTIELKYYKMQFVEV